jgi:trimeric autotransporter adhesin
MIRIAYVTILVCLSLLVNGQTAVNMAGQPNFIYSENFSDQANWTFSTTPANGTFTNGIGAAAWKGNDVVATGTVPDGVRITGATNVYQTGSSSGIYQQNQALVLLATGTTNNTSAVAMDLYLNFTGLNAGTLSFDWASINNFTGDRKASLKIYYSTNGTTFTEIPAAAVLNVTNNSPTSGSINFAALPAALNGASNAIIRFYYYNGTGGTTGSRPKLSIDNMQVTAVPANACVTPTAQPTSLNLTPAYNSVSGSFTASSPSCDGYVVIRSLNNSLSSFPVDGVNYNIGDNVGDGVVISYGNNMSFTSTSLSSSTQYYFFVFAMNNVCSGGVKYLTGSPLVGNTTTLSGSAPCTAPANQGTNLIFSNITLSSIKGSFTASSSTNADHYLVVRSTSSTLSGNPVNGVSYSAGANLGGGVVVTKTQQTSFTANNLASGIQYYFFVFTSSEDNCTGGPVYDVTAPLTGNATTPTVVVCSAPAAQPTNLQLNVTNNSVSGYFAPSVSTDGYIVVISNSASLGAAPVNGTTYNVGSSLGSGTVLANSSATSFIATGLSAGSTKYFYVFAKNDQCSGGPVYQSVNPLQANGTTTAAPALNYYFGNLHAHSSYSDGNKDNSGFTPANDYAYAKNSQCMDFLGISEHNHAQAGMSLSSWTPGLTQAAAATTSNFLAMYGMEWGVISNGGHVLVYGINQLIGWEAGNYNIYVPKSDYTGKPSTTGTTGLFKTINDWPSTAFAMLAHPDNSDYNNIANSGLTPTADSAIAGCALESGPAFSTVTNYTDAPTRLGYYSYYKKMLSRGYHIGPSIDHDTHYTNFGRSNYSRLAVLSATLTETDLLQSIKQRHFYATHDCDTKVVFTLNNQLMGTITTGSNAPAMSVYVTDPTNPTATATIRILQGIAGSGLLPVVIDSAVNASTFNFTDFTLAANTQAYYYAEISIAGGYVITSPIWYTKSTTVNPVTLLSFTANVTQDKSVKLDWRTVNEVNNNRFVIERSADGVKFEAIDSVGGKNQLTENYYSSVDKSPFSGMNYYRLKQVDNDGKISYSNIVAVKIGSVTKADVLMYPNPAKDVLQISINAEAVTDGNISIADGFGKIQRSYTTHFVLGVQQKRIDVLHLNSGTYYLIINIGENRIVKQFLKL